jgi:hypothetical protein
MSESQTTLISTTAATPVTPPVNPATVMSPKASVSDLRVVWDGGVWRDEDPLFSGWSCAMLSWEGEPNCVGLRWNGGEGQPAGMPQSRGIPVWYVLPRPLGEVVLNAMREHTGEVTTESLRAATLDFIHAIRGASPDQLAQLEQQLARLQF